MNAQPISSSRYVPPSSAGDRIFGVAVRWLTRHGISLLGSRVLTVRGRTSGRPQEVPVNLLTLKGDSGSERYLVSPRGNTQWVRNARVAGEATLSVGRRSEAVRLVEVPVGERGPVLRVYLDRWGWEVGRFALGLTGKSTDEELAAAAPGMPVFRVEPGPAA